MNKKYFTIPNDSNNLSIHKNKVISDKKRKFKKNVFKIVIPNSDHNKFYSTIAFNKNGKSNQLSTENSNFIENPLQNKTYNNFMNRDISYYQNLYFQEKLNLKKEKEKNEKIQIQNFKLHKDNTILKNKINKIIKQLDRAIILIEKTHEQSINNLDIKQEEINILNTKINTMKEENQTNLQNYHKKLKSLSALGSTEKNSLQGQIKILKKNLDICMNNKNLSDIQNKEIINKLSKELEENKNLENFENLKLFYELKECKYQFNDLKIKYSILETEFNKLKYMEKNNNKLLKDNIKLLEDDSKTINGLQLKIKNYKDEINNINNEKQNLIKDIILLKSQINKGKDSENIKNSSEYLMKEKMRNGEKLTIKKDSKNENVDKNKIKNKSEYEGMFRLESENIKLKEDIKKLKEKEKNLNKELDDYEKEAKDSEKEINLLRGQIIELYKINNLDIKNKESNHLLFIKRFKGFVDKIMMKNKIQIYLRMKIEQIKSGKMIDKLTK